MSIIVSIEEVPTEGLKGLVTSFVLREGTDYGEQEVDLDVKVEQVIQALKAGSAKIIYSELHESFDIVPADQIPSDGLPDEEMD